MRISSIHVDIYSIHSVQHFSLKNKVVCASQKITIAHNLFCFEWRVVFSAISSLCWVWCGVCLSVCGYTCIHITYTYTISAAWKCGMWCDVSRYHTIAFYELTIVTFRVFERFYRLALTIALATRSRSRSRSFSLLRLLYLFYFHLLVRKSMSIHINKLLFFGTHNSKMSRVINGGIVSVPIPQFICSLSFHSAFSHIFSFPRDPLPVRFCHLLSLSR